MWGDEERGSNISVDWVSVSDVGSDLAFCAAESRYSCDVTQQSIRPTGVIIEAKFVGVGGLLHLCRGPEPAHSQPNDGLLLCGAEGVPPGGIRVVLYHGSM